MNGKNPLLLPSGLYDLLPPDARKESGAVTALLGCFEAFGYHQVTPPLMEFEASMLAGRGESIALQTFRIMDPMSQQMMGIRTDMTLQAARIAQTRLSRQPRPLRLCYAGPVLQIKPEPLRNERQLTQAGIELIGAGSAEADAEVMVVAAEALKTLGIEDVSIDINLPSLLSELCPEALSAPVLKQQIREALLRKDPKIIASLPVANASLLAQLTEAAGPAESALATLKKLNIAQADAIATVIARMKRDCPQVSLTLDPMEYRGFDYHQGISFSIFVKGLRHELGRGGRYQAEKETATGFTLYVTHLLRLLPAPGEAKRILVPDNTAMDKATTLRKEGWVTIYALSENIQKEAGSLGIPHILVNGKIEKL